MGEGSTDNLKEDLMMITSYLKRSTMLEGKQRAPRSLLDSIVRTKNFFNAPPNSRAVKLAKSLDTNTHAARSLVDAATSSTKNT